MQAQYGAFHNAIDKLYSEPSLAHLNLAGNADTPTVSDDTFNSVADLIFNAGGFDLSQFKDPAVRKLISETAKAINAGVSSKLPENCPATLRYALENNGFIFSGFKNFHAMREIGQSMVTDKGTIKPYADFHKEVKAVKATYFDNWLHAEYYHALGSCQMAARWHEYAKSGDKYDLQYRTAEDSHVRQEHRLLDGITLPLSDPFWDKYFPPNGWGCRCTTVQVRKGKYPLSDPKDAMKRGDDSTDDIKQRMFRFNPGKELKLFPPKHPYYKTPASDKKVVEKVSTEVMGKQVATELTQWTKDNLPEVKVGKFKAKRFDVVLADSQQHVAITKNFYQECISKYQDDPLYIVKLYYARMAHLLLPLSTHLRQEPGTHHDGSLFEVYQFNKDSKYIIEFKVKCNNDGWFLHYMRLYEK